jgi:hypothetical protein
MANDCSIKTLKSSLGNDNLNKYGYFRIEFRELNNASVYLEKLNPSVLNCYTKIVNPTDNTYYTGGIINSSSGVKEGYIATNAQYPGFKVKTESGTCVEISRKYDITSITPSGTSYYPDARIKTSDLKFMTNLGVIQMSNFAESTVPDMNFGLVGTLEDLSRLPLTRLATSFSGNLFGSVNALAGKSLTKLILARCGEITGNLSSVVNASLTEINIYASKISGDLEDFYNGNTARCPSLTKIDVRHCANITVRRSTLNKLSAANVTVNYTQTPIEDV